MKRNYWGFILNQTEDHSKKSYIVYFTKISIIDNFLQFSKLYFFNLIVTYNIPTSTEYKTGLDFTKQFPNGILRFGSLWFPHYVAKVPWQLWHIWICWLTIIENIMTKCTSLLNQIWQNLVFSTVKAHMPIFCYLFPEYFRFYLSMKGHLLSRRLIIPISTFVNGLQ